MHIITVFDDLKRVDWLELYGEASWFSKMIVWTGEPEPTPCWRILFSIVLSYSTKSYPEIFFPLLFISYISLFMVCIGNNNFVVVAIIMNDVTKYWKGKTMCTSYIINLDWFFSIKYDAEMWIWFGSVCYTYYLHVICNIRRGCSKPCIIIVIHGWLIASGYDSSLKDFTLYFPYYSMVCCWGYIYTHNNFFSLSRGPSANHHQTKKCAHVSEEIGINGVVTTFLVFNWWVVFPPKTMERSTCTMLTDSWFFSNTK